MTGAKAGIGVGATAGCLTLVALGAWLFWSWKRKASRALSSSSSAVVPAKTEAPGELPEGSSVAEVSGQPLPPREMYASRYREVNPEDPAELVDDTRSRSM